VKYGVTPAQIADPNWLSQDSDSDGVKNESEMWAGTNPFSASMTMKVSSIAKSGGTVSVDFPTVIGKQYRLQATTNLANPASWATVVTTPGQILGDGNTATLTVPHVANRYYRILVHDLDTDGDGLSDWAEAAVGLNPNSQTSASGVNDRDFLMANIALPSTVTIKATTPFASEDGPQAGMVTISRALGFEPITVNLNTSGTAVAGVDFTTLTPSPVVLAAGVRSVSLNVNPMADASVKGSRSVTATLVPPGGANPVYVVGTPNSATVIINDSTAANGTGLLGEYFDTSSTTYANAANFALAQLKASRVDPTVNFNWNVGLPTGGSLLSTTNDNWAARFDGYLLPPADGGYEFDIQADDGAKVWVNGVLVIDAWLPGSSTVTPKPTTAPVVLTTAARALIRVEYYDLQGSASVNLRWKPPGGGGFVNIPATDIFLDDTTAAKGWTGLYWTNTGFVGLPRFADYPAALNLSWGTVQPSQMLPSADNFSARWEGYVSPTPPTVTISAGTAATVTLSSHGLTPGAEVKFATTGALPSPITAGTPYYMLATGSSSSVFRISSMPGGAVINTSGSTQSGAHTLLAARNYTFDVQASDGARVYVDLDQNGSFGAGETVIDAWMPDVAAGTAAASNAYGLVTGQRYKLRLDYYEDTGSALVKLRWKLNAGSFAALPLANVFRGVTGSTTGWWASYFSNAALTDPPLYSVQDTATSGVTYDYAAGKPATATLGTTTSDNWAGKWEGYLNPSATGNFTFSAVADDGARVYVDNNLVIDAWNGFTAVRVTSGNVALTAGTPVPFRVEYNELTGNASCVLEWTPPGGSLATIPAANYFQDQVMTVPGVKGTYWSNVGMIGAPMYADSLAQVNVNYGSSRPTGALTDTDFSITWEGYVQPTSATAGTYAFDLQADDGARVFLDLDQSGTFEAGETILDAWTANSATAVPLVSSNYSLTAGQRYRMRVEFYDAAEAALLKLRWRLPGATTFAAIPAVNLFRTDNTPEAGLFATYYQNPTLSAPLAYGIVETPASAITLDLGAGKPHPLVHQDAFSIRWSGQVQPQFSETYSFVVNADDAAKLWINGQEQTLLMASAANSAGTYSYDSGTGNAVVTHTNIPAGSFAVNEKVRVDPTGGILSALFAYADYPISAIGTGSFTIPFGVGVAVTGTGSCNIEWINKPVDWPTLTAVDRYARIPLQGGVRYDIRLDYFENTGTASCRLSWYSPSQPLQIVPQTRLYPKSVTQAPPAHVSPPSATALVGGQFSHQIVGTNGVDGMNVMVSGNPAWLSYASGTNGANGVLSGTPPSGAAGDYQVLITITNAEGTSTSVLNLRVEDTGGTIVREFWNGIAGTSVASIPVGITASGTASLATLEGPTGSENYGARVRGYITAPATGNYYFWIAANNAAELWISNDDEPVNASKRAWVTAGNLVPQTWTGEPNQKSPWLALEEGKRYYIEILHKAGAGAGADNLAVGWSKPGEPVTAPGQVVPGHVLSRYVAPAAGTTPGTLYVSTMLSQNGAVTTGVGTSTLRLSEDETTATMRYTYRGLTGPITQEHIHVDPYLAKPSAIVFDIDMPVTPGDGLQPDGSYKWTILDVSPYSAAEIREIIKQGKAYINLHTALYPTGEIRGNYTLAGGSRTFTPPPQPPSWTDDHATDAGAVRFLTQATFGPNIADITALKAMASYEAWIDNQFDPLSPSSQPASYQLAEVLARELSDASGGAQFSEDLTFNAWWRNSISGPDQLRQRVAFALSQIHVVSAQGPLDNRADALSYFYDKLVEHAFGNFRDILENTTLTPTMGRYLDMKENDKPDQTVGRIPNENYGREIMQLFSIGLFRMWPDGTLILSSKDAPVDTYTQREIVGLAHVFTGWDDGYDGPYRTTLGAASAWTRQMREVPARHYTGPKRVLNNEVLPGLATVVGRGLDPYATHSSTEINDPNYTSLPAKELDAAHDMLFNHPNTGPLICRQLIQRLVTSNPSRDYLYRVVQKFNDDGSGVRGEMKAVIKAILLDYEARSTDQIAKPVFGKQREPLLRVAAAARAFRQDASAGTYNQPAGSHVINITAANKHGAGNTVFLEFPKTWAVGDTTPTSEAYTVLTAPAPTATTFSVNAKGWTGISSNASTNAGVSGTYSQTAGATTMTITIGSHWLGVGQKAYLDFGNVTTGAAVPDGVYTAVTSTSTGSGSSGGTTFTITAPDTTARTGYVRMVRFTGSYTVTNSGLAVPNDKRITLDTTFGGIADHHLIAGNPIYLNFTAGNPQPVDAEFVVESVLDSNTFTVLTNNAGTGNGSSADNGMWMFPLVNQPMTRSGTVNALPSTFNVGNITSDIEQTPLNSPTVFNFFLPDFKFPGALASAGITTPEFQDTAETTVVRQSNFIFNGLFNPANTNGISSFKSGGNALVMDLTPWMANATDLGLGAGPQTGQAWTSNANLPTLISRLNMLLVGGQIPASVSAVIQNFLTYEQTISSIPVSNPCSITTPSAHGLVNGDTVTITGVTGGTYRNPANSANVSISQAFTVAVTNSTTFTLGIAGGVQCTVVPTNLTNARISFVPYSDTAPTDTNKRDRLRGVLHLILTSPNYTIQR